MRLTALFLLALFPFVGAVLLYWVPRRTAAAAYRRARQRTAATANALDEQRKRVEAADARLQESQQRLGDGGDNRPV